MRLAYIDESYTDAWYFIGAVIVSDRSAPIVERALEAVVQVVRDKYLTSHTGPLELHGHPIFQGKDDWKPLADKPRLRIGLYESAMRAVAQQDVHVLLRGLDRCRHEDRYVNPWPAHEVVLQHMLERLNDFGRSVNEQILVIADEVDDPNRHRLDLQNFKQSGTPGYRSSTLDHILDTLHFAPSHHSRLVQAADLVTFMHRRRRMNTTADPRAAAANERIWAPIQACVRHELLTCP